MQKPTQALKSVKDPDNTFALNPKWVRTLPSLIYFSCDMTPPFHKKINSNIKGAETHPALKSGKDPGDTFNLNPKWARTLPSLIYFSWHIYREPPPPSTKKNIQLSKLIFDTLL